MPALFGLINPLDTCDAAGLLADMAGRLKHHSWYTESRFYDRAEGLALGRTSLGFVNTAEQPAYNEDRSLLAMMEGEILDYDEQRKALTARGHTFRGQSHAELLLHGYESAGSAFFKALHGNFAAAIWDSDLQRLILTNDRFGIKPLYYAELPDRLLFASEIKALLADPEISRSINIRGLAQFFTFGQLLGEDTLLQNVHLLPAAGWLTFDVGTRKVSIERYWRLAEAGVDIPKDETALLDRLNDAFRRATERCCTGKNKLGLSLSGGLDSRVILAAVDSQRPLTTVTMGVDGSMDQRSSAALAAMTNRPHHAYVLNDRFLAHFEQHIHRMVHLTDGHYLSQCIVMPTLSFYQDLGIEVLLRGHAGELMHMEKAYNFSMDKDALALRDSTALEDWLFRRLRTYLWDPTSDGDLFVPAIQQQIEGLARQSLHECVQQSDAVASTPQRIAHMFLSQRTRRETAMSMVKFGSVVETRLPYVDNDLIDLLLATPPELKMGDRIQTHILRRRFPGFLGVMNSNTGAAMNAGRLTRWFGKLRMKVLAKLGVRGYQPYERLGLWLRRELQAFIIHILLSDQCLQRGIFAPGSVRKVVHEHLTARRNHTYLLMAMLIFELGQRRLLDVSSATTNGNDHRCVPAISMPVRCQE